ncbi:MAG: aspartate carbamoyltransferase regulatory subunit [Chlamydiae bacterium CG10_big_fil_rev_8_21_14_0_10_35_9]|nr:MAG: aspartate carbamoyltransferase regulatory subunit [Chlamydiae bacterium CG10_big_fil_rev_8_21_14_0_10_35_9]
MLDKTLLVAAIKNGTVIDHIAQGEGLKILRLLNFYLHEDLVTIGLNLPSKALGKKDLIKIENCQINVEQAKQIALFSPLATINYIENYKVVRKISNTLPSQISSVLICPNHQCITNHERIKTYFIVEQIGSLTELSCKYCCKKFSKEEIKEFISDRN